MKRKALFNWLPVRFAAFVAPLIAAWPQRAAAGDYVWDNAGVVIGAGVATTVNWSAANTWNPDGQTPNNIWANAILNQTNAATPWGASLTASTVLNLDMGTSAVALNSFRQTNNGTAPTNPNNITTNIVGTGGLTLNQIMMTGGGNLQFGPTQPLSSAVDAAYNPGGHLRVTNTDDSSLQLQGQITVPGNFVKDGTGLVRFGSSGATFTNAIAGDIIVNGGTLQASNGASGNVLGGAGRVILNGAGSTLQLNAEYSAAYGRNVVINSAPIVTISADRSSAATGQTLSLGTVTVNSNNGYVALNSANSYNLSLAGLAIGANNVNIRNGLNNTIGSDSTGHALVGALSGSGALSFSGAGGNSSQGFTFNAPGPAFTGTLSLFEGGNNIVTSTGAFGSATATLGHGGNTLPVAYPNPSIGSLASPTVQSNPWSSLLKYNANNPSSAAVDVVVNGASQVNMGVVPGGSDVIRLNRFGILQGDSAELAGFTAGTNLLLPAADAVIGHESLGGSDPAGLPATASHYFGASANLNGPITVGAGTPWKGVSTDRFARTIGGGATILTVNGGDNNPATTEVSIAALNQQNLTLLGSAGDTWASASGQKMTVAIEGYGSGFNGLNAGGVPGGVVILGQTAAASGLAANVDAINVNSGALQVGVNGALGGVPVNLNNGGGLDIAGALTGALDAPINVNSGGKLVLNDAVVMSAGANPITVNSGGHLWLTGGAPANILGGGTQPITFAGTGHTVRVSTDNVTGLDAAVPNSGATWEIASNGTSNNVANIWGTTFALNSGRTVIQTAGLSTDGGVITNDNGGTRFLDAPLTIGNAGATIAASTGTSLVFNDTTGNTPVVVGTGVTAGTIPVQIGSLTPINGIMKTENPVLRSNNADNVVLPHNGSPQVFFTNGLKSGTVNLVTGTLGLDGPAANTAIAGDIVMGANTRLYLGDGGNIATGNGFGGAAPRRGDLTPLLMGTGVTSAGNKIILGNYSRAEMGIDQTDPAYTASAGANGSRGQINQAFVITGDVNPDDRRSFWVNRSAGSTATAVDFNDVTIRNNGHLAFQEANTDVRAAIKLETSGTVSPFSPWDFKSISNVDSSGAGSTASKTLTLGVMNTPVQPMALYGSVDSGIKINNDYSRFELRDGASLPEGFVFNDNAAARTVLSVQGTTSGGPSNGTDHTLSFVQGHDGTANALGNGTFNLNRDNAAGGYVDEVAEGSSLTNTVNARIKINAAGATLFADRNTDNVLTGVVRYNDVAVSAPNVSLATRNGTDLEVGTLTVNQNTVVRADGARTDNNTDALGSIRVGHVSAAANDVHFQNGRTTITGNVTADVVTAGGTSLEFNPGLAGTSTVNVSGVQVNSLLAARSGTTDFGTANLQSNPAGTMVAGLREGVISGASIDLAASNPAGNASTANGYDSSNLGIRLDPRIAQNNYSALTVTDTAAGWSNNQTWVYTGQIYDADGTFSLAENIDDSVSIKIDGQVVLFNRNSGAASVVGSNAAAANGYTPAGGGLASGAGAAGVNPNESYRQVTSTGTKDGFAAGAWQANSVDASLSGILADTTVANANEYGGTLNFGAGAGGDGWHDIEIRIHNGGGGASSPNTLGFGNYFGLGLNSSGSTSLLGTDYAKPVDDGSMNLFRTTTVAKGNVDIDNDAAVFAGNVKEIGALTFGRSGVAGDAALVLRAATAGGVDSLNIAATSTGAALMDIVSPAGKVTAGQFNLADTESFDFNTIAGSKGELEITQGTALTANAGGVVTVAGGTLRLSNISGSATGSAQLTVNGGTLAGNGSASSPVILASGSIAPGNSPGLLTLGDASGVGLSASGGALEIELAGASATADGALYDVLSVNGSVDLGSSTVLNLALNYAPSMGDSYWILLNDGIDPITGEFNGLPEGSLVTAGGSQFQITYKADGSSTGASSLTGGNDVALVVVPEPGSTALAAAAGLLALGRRRRNQA